MCHSAIDAAADREYKLALTTLSRAGGVRQDRVGLAVATAEIAGNVEVRAVARRNVGSLSPWHLILLLAIVLLVVGPGRLPETGAAVGRVLRDFKSALAGSTDELAGHDGTENVVAGASESSVALRADPLAIRPPEDGHDVGGAP